MKKKWKNNALKFIGAVVVIMLMLNPETIQLALFIDAVGLDMFLLLIEVQVLTIAGFMFRTSIKPVIVFFKHITWRFIFIPSWREIRKNPAAIGYMLPSAATFMCFLVFSAAIESVSNILI